MILMINEAALKMIPNTLSKTFLMWGRNVGYQYSLIYPFKAQERHFCKKNNICKYVVFFQKRYQALNYSDIFQ